MSISRRREERILDSNERELVDKSRHPAVSELDDKDLAQLVRLLRERRDRARDIAKTQRRNVRGKGTAEAKEGAERGNTEKAAALGQALQRAGKEVARRQR